MSVGGILTIIFLCILVVLAMVFYPSSDTIINSVDTAGFDAITANITVALPFILLGAPVIWLIFRKRGE
jgi:hypothetical protein